MKNFTLPKIAIASTLFLTISVPQVTADPNDSSKAQGSRARMENQSEKEETIKILLTATETYNNLLDKTGIPRDLVAKANCIAVIPNVKSRALVVGRQTGNGVISCKTSGEKMTEWSSPTFIELSSTSIGAQAGSDSKSLVFFIVGDEESRRFIDGSTTFGTDLNVVAGPVAGGIDKNFRISSGVYSYASAERGIFAGLSLSGANVSVDNKNNKNFYGKELKVEEALKMKRSNDIEGEERNFTNALATTPQKVKG